MDHQFLTIAALQDAKLKEGTFFELAAGIPQRDPRQRFIRPPPIHHMLKSKTVFKGGVDQLALARRVSILDGCLRPHYRQDGGR